MHYAEHTRWKAHNGVTCDSTEKHTSSKVQSTPAAAAAAASTTDSRRCFFLRLGRLRQRRLVLFSLRSFRQIGRQVKFFHGESLPPQLEGQIEG